LLGAFNLESQVAMAVLTLTAALWPVSAEIVAELAKMSGVLHSVTLLLTVPVTTQLSMPELISA